MKLFFNVENVGEMSVTKLIVEIEPTEIPKDGLSITSEDIFFTINQGSFVSDNMTLEEYLLGEEFQEADGENNGSIH